MFSYNCMKKTVKVKCNPRDLYEIKEGLGLVENTGSIEVELCIDESKANYTFLVKSPFVEDWDFSDSPIKEEPKEEEIPNLFAIHGPILTNGTTWEDSKAELINWLKEIWSADLDYSSVFKFIVAAWNTALRGEKLEKTNIMNNPSYTIQDKDDTFIQMLSFILKGPKAIETLVSSLHSVWGKIDETTTITQLFEMMFGIRLSGL